MEFVLHHREDAIQAYSWYSLGGFVGLNDYALMFAAVAHTMIMKAANCFRTKCRIYRVNCCFGHLYSLRLKISIGYSLRFFTFRWMGLCAQKCMYFIKKICSAKDHHSLTEYYLFIINYAFHQLSWFIYNFSCNLTCTTPVGGVLTLRASSNKDDKRRLLSLSDNVVTFLCFLILFISKCSLGK